MEREKIGSTKLAGMIGNSKQNITRWANQSRALPPEWADKIAPILKTTAAELLLVDTPTSYIERSMPDPDLNLITRQLDRLITEIASMRDDMSVLTAIVMRLDGSQSALLQELRATHSQVARMNDRIRKLENSET